MFNKDHMEKMEHILSAAAIYCIFVRQLLGMMDVVMKQIEVDCGQQMINADFFNHLEC